MLLDAPLPRLLRHDAHLTPLGLVIQLPVLHQAPKLVIELSALLLGQLDQLVIRLVYEVPLEVLAHDRRNQEQNALFEVLSQHDRGIVVLLLFVVA